MKAFMTLEQPEKRHGADEPWTAWGVGNPDIQGKAPQAHRSAPDGRIERAIDAALAVIFIAACAVLAWVGIVFS